jgi:hypothetical protein
LSVVVIPPDGDHAQTTFACAGTAVHSGAMSDVTQILAQIDAADPTAADPTAAEQLLPLVYYELRKLAAAKVAHEKQGQTLQATALVHEAYLRLVDVPQAKQCSMGAPAATWTAVACALSSIRTRATAAPAATCAANRRRTATRERVLCRRRHLQGAMRRSPVGPEQLRRMRHRVPFADHLRSGRVLQPLPGRRHVLRRDLHQHQL